MEIPPPIMKGDISYAYATGMVRGLERKLLSRGDFNRLLELPNEQLWQLLEEFGYPPIKDHNWEKSLDEEFTRVLQILTSLSHEKKFNEAFLAKFDFLNLALLLKQKQPEGLIEERTFLWGNLDINMLKKGIENEEEANFPDYIQQPYLRALKAFENTGNPSLIDNILEYAYYKHLQQNTADNPFVNQFVGMKTDFNNTALFLRLKIQKQTLKTFWDYFLPQGDLNLGFYKKCAEAEIEMLVPIFRNTKYGRLFADAVGEIINHSNFLQYKKLTDGLLIQKLKLNRFSPFGFEVLFSYIHLKEFEIKILRSIIKSKLANIPKDLIKKALPYGTI